MAIFNDYELGTDLPRKASTPRRVSPRRVSPRRVSPRRVKLTKTKNPFSLSNVSNSNVKSTTIFKSSGSYNGVGIGGNPLSISINNPGAPPPLTMVSSTAKPSKWGGLMGLASQYLAGSLRNSTVQTADGQTPIYNPQTNSSSYAPPGYPPQLNDETVDDSPDNRRRKGAGADVGDSLGQGFDGIIKWASENPLIVAGAGLGAYLLFRQPPKYGNRG